jgi:hypothetical protein
MPDVLVVDDSSVGQPCRHRRHPWQLLFPRYVAMLSFQAFSFVFDSGLILFIDAVMAVDSGKRILELLGFVCHTFGLLIYLSRDLNPRYF